MMSDEIKYLLNNGMTIEEIRKEIRVSKEKLKQYLEDGTSLGNAKDRLKKLYSSTKKDDEALKVKEVENKLKGNYDYEELEEVKIPMNMKLRHTAS